MSDNNTNLYSYEKKSYLDLFLDNNLTPPKKKDTPYFGDEEENAIVLYNNEETPQKVKNKLYETTIGPAFKEIVNGVLKMPMFRKLGSLNREEVIENTLFRLIEKIHKFEAGRIGKSGQPVKAYSYFSTVAKHYILEQKIRNEKILKNKADVESSIDLSILSEDTLEKVSNYNKSEIEFTDCLINFKNTKHLIVNSIKELIAAEERSEKQDGDFIKLGYCLKYLIEHWDKIEFSKKNEFMRILTLYSGLPQQKVSFLFKKFKLNSLKKIKPSLLNKKKVVVVIVEERDEEEDMYDLLRLAQEEEEKIFLESGEEREEEIPDIPEGYDISSMEEFEQQLYRSENKRNKLQWKKSQGLL